jgi:hypothetical protein
MNAMQQDAGDGKSPPEVRLDLVERVRREIAAGTYDTDEKLHLALERLLEQLENE